jgi:hypothetical protein
VGIDVSLETAHRDAVEPPIVDARDVLRDALRDLPAAWYPHLAHIDPAGRTSFNAVQMSALLLEWRKLMVELEDPAARLAMTDIERLAVRCAGEPKLSLVFTGR